MTGGSGYLGTHVRRFFNADDFSRRANRDITEPFDVSMVADYDVVIHLAAHLDKNPDAAEECFRTNAEGTANVLRQMRSHAIFIYASTKDVYGTHAEQYPEVPETCSTAYDGQSALAWSKFLGERYVDYYARERNLRACIFRLSNVYARPTEGNEMGFVTHYVEAVKRRWKLRLPLHGQPIRDILHVDDFARACRAFIDSPIAYGMYNLGGGKENAASLQEMLQTVSRMIQIEPVIDEHAHMEAPVPLNYISDLRRVRDDLGWRPAIGLEEGLRSLL